MRILDPFEEYGSCGLVANLASSCGTGGQPLDGLSLTADQRVRVDELARLTLNSLTGGIVANCPVTVRPCTPRYAAGAYSWTWTGLTYLSALDSTAWLNACGCTFACSCTSAARLDLNGPVAEVIEVVIDGSVVDSTTYRLEGQWLVREGGLTWPATQDMDLPLTEEGTFAVTYRPGYALGPAGEGALGLLVHEYAKASCGQKCKLPTGVTNITRNGVTMAINRSLFHDGLTGTPEVDVYVQSVNPNRLRGVPVVTSSDVREHRVI